jgi:hypothetical protein
LLLGDLAENQHLNKVEWVIDLMNGGTLDTDTGAEGYDGVQGTDPAGRGDVTTPVDGTTIRDLGNEPFVVRGLRNANGSPAKWYAVMGNHDSKVQGTVPDDMPGWRDLARAHALGSVKINDLAPDRQNEACDVIQNHPEDLATFLQDVFTDALTDPMSVGTVSVVPPDAKRQLLNKQQWIDAFADAPGVPVGHGLGTDTLCPDAYDDPFARRSCYSFTEGEFHYIVIDGNPAPGLDGGSIDDAQWQWLTKQLRSSSRSYFSSGKRVSNPAATDRMIVIVSHHPLRRFDNTGTIPGTNDERTAEELGALLLDYPNVVLHSAGHSHENRIVPHRSTFGTSYWEVNTAAIADWPNQSRSIEIADNRDGTMSIHTVVFDGASHPDPRAVSWTGDDPSDETGAGLARDVNETWLASLGRETARHDRQHSDDASRATAEGTPKDRNAELVLKAPAFIAPAAQAPDDDDGPTPVLPATGPPLAGSLLGAALAAGALVARRCFVRIR